MRHCLSIFALCLVTAACLPIARVYAVFEPPVGPVRQIEPAGRETESLPGYPVVRVDTAACADFDAALQAVSDGAYVTIIAEGVPLQPTLTAGEQAALSKALLGGRAVPVDFALAHIGMAFDYATVQITPGLFLLRKRYSDRRDLPCVNYAELDHSLHQMLALTQPFVPPTPIGPLSLPQQFIGSLSNAQRAEAENGLSWLDMTPDQRSLCLSAIGGQFELGADALAACVRQIDGLRGPRTTFSCVSTSVGDKFGCEEYVTTSDGDDTASKGFPLLLFAVQITPAAPAEYGGLPLPTDLDRRLAQGMLANRLPSTLTLAEAANRIVAADAANRVSDGDAPPVHISIDSEIDDKPVCAFGLANNSADRVVRALAELYGYEVLQPRLGQFRLAMPSAHIVRSPEDLVTQIARLIPPSFVPLKSEFAAVVAARAKGAAARDRRPVPMSIVDRASPASGPPGRPSAGKTAPDHGSTSRYATALNRLLVLAKPAVAAPASPPVSAASIGPEALRLLSLLCLDGMLGPAVEWVLTKPMPEYIFDPQQIVAVSSVSGQAGHEREVRTQFGYRDKDGIFRCVIEFSYPDETLGGGINRQ